MAEERIIDRLDKFMEYSKLNDNMLTVSCNLSIGLLGKARKGKSDIGKKSIEKILYKYPELSRVWILTGEGCMLESQNKNHGNINNGTVEGSQVIGNADLVNEQSKQITMLLQQIQTQSEQINKLIDLLSTK